MTNGSEYLPTPAYLPACYRLLHTSIAFLVLAVVFVSVRFVSRSLQKSAKWGWDDWLLIPAVVCQVMFCVSGIVSAKHLADFESADPNTTDPAVFHELTIFFIWIWVAQLMLPLALTFPKLSVLALYLRVLRGKWTRIAIWAVFAIVACTGIAYFFACLFLCIPINTFWTGNPNGKCIDEQALHQAISGPSLAADVAILALPLHTIWNLKASKARRVGIFVTFATGSVGLAAGIVRWAIWFHINILSTDMRGPLVLDTWSLVETGIYLMAACMPSMRGLFGRVGPWVSSHFSSTSSSRQRLDQRNNSDTVGMQGSKGSSTVKEGVASTGSSNSDHDRRDEKYIRDLENQGVRELRSADSFGSGSIGDEASRQPQIVEERHL